MSWTSCCRDRRRNCPAISMESDFLLIRDDFGAVVKIPLASVNDLLVTIQQEAVVPVAETSEQLVFKAVQLT